MQMPQHSVTVLLFAICLGGATIFALGYFPLSFSDNVRAGTPDLPEAIDDVPLNRTAVYRSHFNQSVLLVIDAWRRDFARRPADMPHLQRMRLAGDGCLLNVHVQSPTVTMPRIKSLTTGTVPNFIDVVLNLGGGELRIDSLVHQLLVSARGQLVFAGDDTWVKMFPDAFGRSHPNSDSLYVNDFEEGDRNISRQLVAELGAKDWTLLVLHYLGLDHIGHVEGPFSPRVPMKLREMDEVVRRIDEGLRGKRLSSESDATLLVVTGDHGMRDTGGHGGSSYAETNVPLFVVGTKCEETETVYQQFDIAPTLAVLLGVPIPANSIGTLITELLTGRLTVEEQLFAQYYNGRRLIEKITRELGASVVERREYGRQFREATQLHKQFLRHVRQVQNDRTNADNYEVLVKRVRLLYGSSAREISKELATNFVNYDHLYIVLGLFWTSVALLVLVINTSFRRPTFIHIRFKALPMLVAFIAVLGAKEAACQDASGAYALCAQPFWHTIIYALISAIIVQFLLNVCAAHLNHFDCHTGTIEHASSSGAVLLWSCAAATVAHAALYGSSSMVEEEHQTWYSLCTALLLWLAALDVRARVRADWQRCVPGLGPDLSQRNVGKQLGDWRLACWSYAYAVEIKWTLVLVMVTLMRRLNQTGDKWLHVPDVGDWLVMPEHRVWHNLWMGIGLAVMMFRYSYFIGVVTNALIATACALIFLHRTLDQSVTVFGYATTVSSLSVWLFWVHIAQLILFFHLPFARTAVFGTPQCRSVHRLLGINVVVICLYTALLHRPHNIVLNGALLIIGDRVHMACDRIFAGGGRRLQRQRFVVQTVATVWLGQAFFYYQGNSNSLASVDLTAGFVGLGGSGSLVVAGAQVLLNTYAAVFLSWNVLLYRLVGALKGDRMTLEIVLGDVMASVGAMVAVPLVTFLYVTTVFQNHIFVWSVFSPKLLYALCLTVVWFVQIAGVWMLNKLL